MQQAGRGHKSSGMQEEHVQHALEHIAEEKLQALAGKPGAVVDDTHTRMRDILNKMGELRNESQFYLLVNDAISTHQKGWDTLSEIEKKIKVMKKL